MSFLTRAFDYFFDSPEKQLKASFWQAAEAIRSNDNETLKAVLGHTKFDENANLSLLVNAIGVDNLEGFKTVFNTAGVRASQRVLLNRESFLTVHTLNTPMLPYAISRGSERISRFLAEHADTDVQARALLTTYNTFVCPSTCAVHVQDLQAILPDARSLAHKVGMTNVVKIIDARVEGKHALSKPGL